MRLYFCRHGESQANLLHIISNRDLQHALTQAGREQAGELANYLSKFHISRIYSSSVFRAIETSAIIAQRLELGYEVVPALRDFDCGVLEGRSDDAAWKQWQRVMDLWLIEKRYDEHIEAGESFIDVYQRFVPFVQGLVERFAGTQEAIVCVTHGGICKLMLPLVLMNVDTASMEAYPFDYASCVVAELLPDGLTCTEWNRVPYKPIEV